ncbi:MAG TPA: cell filamentation protein Fic [Ignavibacteria bacterium]|nr:cell filamentation protein Fic [Ignavibacteria bacterium]
MAKKKQNNKLIIRNSTAEFLMFTADSRQDGIEVRFENETVWLTQKMMAVLFDCSVDNISLHLKNIFKEEELDENSVIEEYSITASDGKKYKAKHYNLDAIIAVGYRINSKRATQFRQWATKVLKDFAIKGYVIDKERLKNEGYLGKNYFDDLLEIIREIRASERKFYQKITDIYATALDYEPESKITKNFFATVQNKLHYAITGLTAAEIIKERANSKKPHMGLTSWKRSPKGKILKSDVSVAKNYLDKIEIESLDRITNMYLDYAEDQAERKIPMTMQDWVDKLDAFLQFNERDILDNPGKVSAEVAKAFSESKWEKYRVEQDRLYTSDFDKEVKKLLEQKKKK